MKHFLCIITTLILLTACGVDSGHFKISGRFLNMSQGNFYVYSPEGIIDGIDTISVVGGRFTYERPLEQEGTLMLVFPNFSEHPVFAEPGKSVTINADASHMKEMEVKGTKANEQMTKFRKQTAKASPPETVAKAEEFINDHPESPVSVFLLKKYFVQALTPDYAKAERLAATMLKEQPKNGQLVSLQKQLSKLKNRAKGTSLVKFSAKDMNGNTVTDADLGPDASAGQRLMAVIPRGVIFGAENLDPSGYSFASCMTTPRYAGETLVGREHLRRLCPEQFEELARLAYPGEDREA